MGTRCIRPNFQTRLKFKFQSRYSAESIGLNQISSQPATNPQPAAINNVPLNLPAAGTTQTHNNTTAPATTPTQSHNLTNPTPVATEPLPTAPLYKLGFETIQATKLAEYETNMCS